MSVHNAQRDIDKYREIHTPIVSRKFIRNVLLAANTALVEGQGVCYDRTYGTEADLEYSRDWRVALPSQSNHLAFAGVATQDYASKADAQWVNIYEPPSVCKIFSSSGTLLEDNVITCSIEDQSGGVEGVVGQFIYNGFGGRGSARLMQNSSTSLALAELLDGEESGLIDFHPQEFNTASDGGARTTTKYGTTLTEGGSHNTDITTTLADGLWIGQRKMYRHKGPNMVTKDLVVTVTTGKQLDGTTALATITIDTIGEFALLEWNGLHWKLIAHDATIA